MKRIDTLKDLKDWFIGLKLDPAIAKNDLAMKQWERSLAEISIDKNPQLIMGKLWSFWNFAERWIDEKPQIDWHGIDRESCRLRLGK